MSELPAEHPDSTQYRIPNLPTEWVALSDEELFVLLRKVAVANAWNVSSRVEFEATARLIAALKAFKDSSDRSSLSVIRLTFVLVVFTVALVVMTGVLIWLATRV